MSKYRKKPVVIEAVQFHYNQRWSDDICICPAIPNRPHIHTLEGTLALSDGDWIITGVVGEKYPCRPDIFETTYEPAEQ